MPHPVCVCPAVSRGLIRLATPLDYGVAVLCCFHALQHGPGQHEHSYPANEHTVWLEQSDGWVCAKQLLLVSSWGDGLQDLLEQLARMTSWASASWDTLTSKQSSSTASISMSKQQPGHGPFELTATSKYSVQQARKQCLDLYL